MSTTVEEADRGKSSPALVTGKFDSVRPVPLRETLIDASFSRSIAVMAVLLLSTILADGILIWCLGLYFPTGDAVRPLLIGTLLSGAALFYLRRHEDGFVMCLQSLAIVVMFTAAYTVLMYSLAVTSLPLRDDAFMAFDDWCGLRTDHIRAWASARPFIAYPLAIAYDTVILQTAAVVIVLGFSCRRRELEGFILTFMFTTLVSAVCFWLLPASGPYANYDYEPTEAQLRFLRDFDAMRSGSRTLVTWRDAEGLITFPSFHTTWAILLAWAFRSRRWLRWPVAALNVAVIASTLTLGWHYFIDVAGGIVLAAAAIWLVSAIGPWLYDSEGEPRRWRPLSRFSATQHGEAPR